MIRSHCYGADQWVDLAEALLRVSASLEAFEEKLLGLFPQTEIHHGHTHRRYTIFARPDRGPTAGQKIKQASVYIEL